MIHTFTIIHYHLRDGGVTKVIESQIKALQEVNNNLEITLITSSPKPSFIDEDINYVQIRELDYVTVSDIDRGELENLENTLYKSLKDNLSKGSLIHIHNPHLGKNPIFTDILYKLSLENYNVTFHCHDFPEERPLMVENFENYYNSKYEEFKDRLYINRKNVTYAVANREDYNRPIVSNLNITYLPNPVSCTTNKSSKSEIAKKLAISEDLDWYLYPVRAIKRKNIGELILLSLIEPKKSIWLISLAPENSEELELYKKWKEIINRYSLDNIVLNVANKIEFKELLYVSDKIVTTSYREGFGMAFLEPWLINKSVFGRDLEMVTSDFRKCGVAFSKLYKSLNIPTYGDFAELKENIKLEIVIKVLDDKKFLDDIINNNNLDFIFEDVSKDEIESNKNAVSENYSLRKFGERCLSIFL